MPDGPGDHDVVGLEEMRLVLRAPAALRLRRRLVVRFLGGLLPRALRGDVFERAPLERALERVREVPSDGRLFGDHECLGHWEQRSERFKTGYLAACGRA